MISSFIIDAAGVTGVEDLVITGYLPSELGIYTVGHSRVEKSGHVGESSGWGGKRISVEIVWIVDYFYNEV